MTELLDRAMLRLAQDSATPEAVDPAHRAAVLDGLNQARRGDMASDAEIEAAFSRFDS